MGLIGMPREVCLLGLQILVQRFDSASGLQLIAFENDCCLAFSFLIRVAARVITLWSRTAEIPDHSRKAYYCIGLAFASDSLLPPLFVALRIYGLRIRCSALGGTCNVVSRASK